MKGGYNQQNLQKKKKTLEDKHFQIGRASQAPITMDEKFHTIAHHRKILL